MPKRFLANLALEAAPMINKKLCCSDISSAEGQAMAFLARYEIAVAESTVAACRRACGIFTKEAKSCYWQKSLGGYQACGQQRNPRPKRGKLAKET